MPGLFETEINGTKGYIAYFLDKQWWSGANLSLEDFISYVKEDFYNSKTELNKNPEFERYLST